MSRKADVTPLTVCASIFTLIGTAFVLLRIYVRAGLRDVFGLDDWLLSISMLWGLAGYITEMYCACEYFTRIHLSKQVVGADERWRVAMGFNTLAQVGICLYSLANMFSRMAVLYTYRRFTPVERILMRFLIHSAIVMTACLGIATVLMATVSCTPPHLIIYNKDFMDKIGRKELVCLAPRQVFYWMGIGNVVCDVVTFLMPFLLLRKLKAKKMRQELYILFGFGIIVIIISIVRIPVLRILRVLGNFGARNLIKVWILTMLESNAILVVASIPTLKPLWRQLKGMSAASIISRSSNNSGRAGPDQTDDVAQLAPPLPVKRKLSDPDESILRPTVYVTSPIAERADGGDIERAWTRQTEKTLC